MDLPSQPGFHNSLDGGDCLHGGHYMDDLAAKQMRLNKQKKYRSRLVLLKHIRTLEENTI